MTYFGYRAFVVILQSRLNCAANHWKHTEVSARVSQYRQEKYKLVKYKPSRENPTLSEVLVKVLLSLQLRAGFTHLLSSPVVFQYIYSCTLTLFQRAVPRFPQLGVGKTFIKFLKACLFFLRLITCPQRLNFVYYKF